MFIIVKNLGNKACLSTENVLRFELDYYKLFMNTNFKV